MINRCPFCGKKIAENTLICANCGNQIDPNWGQESNNGGSTQPPPPTIKWPEEEQSTDSTVTDEQKEKGRVFVETPLIEKIRRFFEWIRKSPYIIVAAAILIVAGVILGINSFGSSTVPDGKTTVNSTKTDTSTGGGTTTNPVVETTAHKQEKETVLSELASKYRNTNIATVYVDDDDIPEFVIKKGDHSIVLVSSEGDELECLGDLFVCCERENRICVASKSGDKYADTVYCIEDKNWKQSSIGWVKAEYNDNTALIDFSYGIDDKDVAQDTYFDWRDEIYSGGTNLDHAQYILSEDIANASAALAGGNEITQYTQSIAGKDRLNQSFVLNRKVGLLLIPCEGSYEFDLRGGAGGSDGERVTKNITNYDGGGATLKGLVHLNTGDRVFVVVGGHGGHANKEKGVVKGGFNGGGDTYWGGAGGGSTDIYYRGSLIAVAAGGGGGNFGPEGKPGRASTAKKKNMVDSKKGESRGQDFNEDAGGGGGGGWYGGKAGNDGKGDDINGGAGYGGISGYDDEFFKPLDGGDTRGEERANALNCDGICKVVLHLLS